MIPDDEFAEIDLTRAEVDATWDGGVDVEVTSLPSAEHMSRYPPMPPT